MPSGIGPNLILPYGGGIGQSITGLTPFQAQQRGIPGLFGTNPMGTVRNTMDYGTLGGWTSRGPQSMTYQRPGIPLGDPMGAGGNAALFGGSYNPAFAGMGAYERFADVADSYRRRFATDVTDANGNVVLLSPERSAGLRSGQLYGGRGVTGEPLTGVQSDIFKTASGLAQLQQGANRYLNDPATAANMQIYSELSSPFTRGSPAEYLKAAQSAEVGPTTGNLTDQYIPTMGNMTGGMYSGVTGQVQGLQNAYAQDLMNQIAAQGSKDLSLGLQDAQGTMSAMGLGRSGQAQSTALGAWKDIQEANALQRQQILAQFAEQNAARNQQTMLGMGQSAMSANANAILQAQQAAAQANEARLGRMNQAAMAGQQALTGSLEASRAAQRGGLQQGMANTLEWNQGNQQRLLQAMLGGDEAMRQRLQLEAQGQSQGLNDYMRLQATKDQMYSDRLSQMLGLEDRYKTSQNEVLNQMAHYGLMPQQALMQMITGISPTGGSPARTNPWPTLLGQAGLNLAGSYINQMGQPSSSSIYSNTYQLEPPG